jgi:hypothetical protein
MKEGNEVRSMMRQPTSSIEEDTKITKDRHKSRLSRTNSKK